MLKNKIIKILRKYSDFDEDDHKESQEFNSMTGDFEKLINVEVEKRIKERMPSQEEINKWIKSHGYYGSCTEEWYEGLEEGANWILSRLTNSNQKTEHTPQVTPQVPPKTEGGRG